MGWFLKFCPGAAALVVTTFSAMAGKEADAALLEACGRGDEEEAARALRDGADPNASGSWREAPALHVALGEGKAGLVELLVKAGADFRRRAENGGTALHAAAGAGCRDHDEKAGVILNLKRVLEQGLPVNARDKYDREPLELAARECSEVVRILLEKGAVASPKALEAAMMAGNRANAELLMAAGADPAAVLPEGRTMLHALAEVPGYGFTDKKETVWLLDLVAGKGVAVDSRDGDGRTPLLLAAGTQWSLSFDWFLAHGADAKAVDKEGITALMRAADGENAWINAAAKLIAAGCPVDAVDHQGHSVLDRLQASNDWSGILFLLRNGARFTTPAEMLRTALTAWREAPAEPAVMRHMVRLLLPSALETPGFRMGGRPLVPELVFLGDSYLLDLALNKGAKPDEPDAEGRTALMWAAAFRNAEMEDRLRKAGADPTLKDHSGMAARDWADLAAVKLITGDPADAETADGKTPDPETSDRETGAKARLESAVRRQRAEHVRRLLEKGTPVPPGLLSLAVRNGNEEIAGLLLAHGAQVNEPDGEENLPAHFAARKWRRGLMDLLRRSGADLTLKNKEGRSVIDEAREAGYVEWAEELAREAASGAPVKESDRSKDSHKDQ